MLLPAGAEAGEKRAALESDEKRREPHVDDNLYIPFGALVIGYDQLLYPRRVHSPSVDHRSRGPSLPDYPGPKSAVGCAGRLRKNVIRRAEPVAVTLSEAKGLQFAGSG